MNTRSFSCSNSKSHAMRLVRREIWACEGRFGAHGNIVSYLRVEAEPASGLCEGAGSFSPRRQDVCPSLPDETGGG